MTNPETKLFTNDDTTVPTDNDIIINHVDYNKTRCGVENKRYESLLKEGLALGTYKEQLRRAPNNKMIKKIIKSMWEDIKRSKQDSSVR